jgi:hypothetical protein
MQKQDSVLFSFTASGTDPYVSEHSPKLFTALSSFQAPEICSLYSLNVSPAFVRHRIRARFERNRNVTDLRAINVLLLKSRQDYQETMNVWKLPDHVLGILLKDDTRPQRTFLQKFYEGECFALSYFLSPSFLFRPFFLVSARYPHKVTCQSRVFDSDYSCTLLSYR